MANTSEVLRRLDPHVRGLLRQLEALWDEVMGDKGSVSVPSLNTPPSAHTWLELPELDNQTDTWPKPGGGKDVAVFERFRVFERDESLRIGLGYRRRDDGELEIGVFLLRPTSKKRLIVYFQPTEEQASGVLFGPIRGKNGGRSYFRGEETIPPDYADKEVVTLADVAPNHRLREIKVLLARTDDWQTMVEHGAAQVRIRNLTV
jgi:hypothetical protein